MQLHPLFKKLKHLIVLITLCLTPLGEPSLARITPLAFKDVTKYFKKDIYSPTMGMVALETGLIYNMRFYGNFDAGYKKGGEREYIADQSNDPTWSLLKELFPSSGGDLNPATTSNHNFGKHVTSTKTIALLLAYAHRLREENPSEPIHFINMHQDNLPPQIDDNSTQKTIKKEREKTAPQALMITGKELREYLDKMVLNSKSLLTEEYQQYAEKFKIYEEGLRNKYGANPSKDGLNEFNKQIQGFIKNNRIKITDPEDIKNILHYKEKNKKLKISSNKPPRQKQKSSLQLMVDDVFASLTTAHHTEMSKLKENIKNILTHIKDAISMEKEESFYPKYQAEQLILAFFCEKFDDPEAIKELIEDLALLDTKDEIIDKKRASHITIPLLQEKDLPEIAQKAESTIDDFYVLANADIFTRPIPYKAGTSPISNGETRVYDRSNKKEINGTFADCVEVTIRHLFNLILYNPIKRKFYLDALKNYVVNHPNKDLIEENFLSLTKFYQYQGPVLANAGEMVMRSSWNQVVGDLNTLPSRPDIKIQYKHDLPGHDMNSGFINVVNVFRKMFDLTLPEDQEQLDSINLETASLKEKQDWIQAYFELIFTVLNPNQTYKIDTSHLSEEQGRNQQDMFGKMSVVVKDLETYNTKFSFIVDLKFGHGELVDLKTQEETGNNPPQLKEMFETLAENGSIKESLGLLVPSLKSNLTPPLYALYQDLIQDTEARIRAFKAITTLAKAENSKPLLKQPLTHLLNALSWDDDYTLDRFKPLLPALYPLFPEVLKENVKGYRTETFNEADLEKIIEQVPNIEILKIYKTTEIENLNLYGLPKLKTLMLERSSLSSLSLKNLPALRKVDLSDNETLKKIDLADLPSVETIDLGSCSAIEDIGGLQDCLALKSLKLAFTKKLKELPDLSALTKLEKIDLWHSSVANISGLEKCTALKTLSLSNTQNLKKLPDLSLTKLEEINLYRSSVADISGLQKCTALKELNLFEAKNLKNLPDLSALTQLEEISLGKSSIEDISGLQKCTALKTLSLSNTKNLKKLPDLSALTKLEEIDLTYSSVADISGLQNCIALKTMRVRGSKAPFIPQWVFERNIQVVW